MAETTPLPTNTIKANDAKPLAERKDAVVNQPVKEDTSKIGSPDVFLTDRHPNTMTEHNRVRIVQVWADGEDRGYVIADDSSGNSRKIGYFELHEGMQTTEAQAALDRAYDGTAVVL